MANPNAFKVILPSKPMKKKPFMDAIMKEMEAVGGDIQLDYLLTAGTWEHDVTFEVLTSLKGSTAEILVGTDDEVWHYVDEGTKPHVIKPKNKKFLAFPGGKFKAKTKPGSLIAGFGKKASGPTVFSKGVFHPGTKARKFSAAIKKKWAPLLARRLQRTIDKQAEKSGYLLRK